MKGDTATKGKTRSTEWVLVGLTVEFVLMLVLLPWSVQARNPPYHDYGGLVMPHWLVCVLCSYGFIGLALWACIMARGFRTQMACMTLLVMPVLSLRWLGHVIAEGAVRDCCFDGMARVGLEVRIDNEELLPLPTSRELVARLGNDPLTLRPRRVPFYVFWAQPENHRHALNTSLCGRKVRHLSHPESMPFCFDVAPQTAFGYRRVVFADGRMRCISQEDWRRVAKKVNSSRTR